MQFTFNFLCREIDWDLNIQGNKSNAREFLERRGLDLFP